ncbi:MAG: MoaD/ThiS family protein [Planctomycetaceae bacterium]
MTLTIQLFAGARESAGNDRVTVDLPAGACVADLQQTLLSAAPGLGRYGGRLWVAVNGEYAAESDLLHAGAEVAVFPPVSGG